MQLPIISTASNNAFMSTIASLPILEEEEELNLFRAAVEGDRKSYEKIVTHSLKYVIVLAKKIIGRNRRFHRIELDDLIQEGAIGLMRAMKNYDPERGYRLITFASMHIKSRMQEHLRSFSNIIPIYTTHAEKKVYDNLALINAYRDIAEAAEVYGVKVDDILRLKGRMSLALPIACAPEDDEMRNRSGLVYEDELPQTTPGIVDILIDMEESSDDRIDQLLQAMIRLTPREREIIERRCLCEQEDKPTLGALAAEYGISGERVRQLEQQGIKKIKSAVVPA